MLPCMYGSATLAMVESSVCISIASMARGGDQAAIGHAGGVGHGPSGRPLRAAPEGGGSEAGQHFSWTLAIAAGALCSG